MKRFLSLLLALALLTTVFTSCDVLMGDPNGSTQPTPPSPSPDPDAARPSGKPIETTPERVETVEPETVEPETVHRHTWSEWAEIRQSTCTEPGVMERACACGETEMQSMEPAGHTPGAEATCTDPQNCVICGEELTAAKGHAEVTDAAVAPTCTKTGLTEGKHCSVCSKILTAQETVDALGHTPGAEATCTEPQRCTACGVTLASAKGHAYTSAVTPPTATEDGYTTYTCSVCGNMYETAIKPISFTVAADNRTKIGYTGKAGEKLVIPAVFQADNGTWYRVTSIGSSAFRGCTGLTTIEIPDSVTLIGSSAFSGCTGLTSIEIPDSGTGIGSSAFSGCTGLTSIVIPNSVTSIRYEAFAYCEGLTSIIIPDSVTGIDEWAFSYCSNLTSIVIPDSVTIIVSSAFYGCKGLACITFEGTTAQWKAIVKITGWDDSIPATEVICSDGVVSLN